MLKATHDPRHKETQRIHIRLRIVRALSVRSIITFAAKAKSFTDAGKKLHRPKQKVSKPQTKSFTAQAKNIHTADVSAWIFEN